MTRFLAYSTYRLGPEHLAAFVLLTMAAKEPSEVKEAIKRNYRVGASFRYALGPVYLAAVPYMKQRFPALKSGDVPHTADKLDNP